MVTKILGILIQNWL